MSTLESLLRGAWHDWRRQFRRCRRTASTKAVHQARIESRRVQTILSLFDAGGYRHTRPIRKVVKATLEALSELRDIHVQLRAARELVEEHPLARPFLDQFARRERRVRTSARAALRRIRIKPATRACRRLAHAAAADSPAAVRRAARRAMIEAWKAVEDRVREVDTSDPHTIHRVRVGLKTVRYMLDAGIGLKTLAPRLEALDGAEVADAVRRMGELHDAEMLSSRLTAFAGRRPANAAAVASAQATLKHRHDQLLRQVMADLPVLRRIHVRTGEPRVRDAASARQAPQRRGR
jgi:CHAD domain-containing protein